MKDSLNKTISSGDVNYDLTISFVGLTDEQVQAYAFSFLAWKVQRVIRDASEDERAKWAADGINLHATEVGKPIITTEQMIAKMSPEQKQAALEQLQAELEAA